MYQMVIESDDPDRFLPGTWNFYRSPGLTVWETAQDIAARENVRVVKILDEQGKEVPS